MKMISKCLVWVVVMFFISFDGLTVQIPDSWKDKAIIEIKAGQTHTFPVLLGGIWMLKASSTPVKGYFRDQVGKQGDINITDNTPKYRSFQYGPIEMTIEQGTVWYYTSL